MHDEDLPPPAAAALAQAALASARARPRQLSASCIPSIRSLHTIITQMSDIRQLEGDREVRARL